MIQDHCCRLCRGKMDLTHSEKTYEPLGSYCVTTDEKFYLVSACSSEALEVDRLNFDIKLSRKDVVPNTAVSRPVCLLLGIIHLVSGPYLLLATEKRCVGSINSHMVYEVARTELVSFSKTNIHLSESQEKDNQSYVGMIDYVLSMPGFYFSYSFDLTHTLQRRHHLLGMKPNFNLMPLHERADKRFMWNAHLMQDLLVLPELHRFIVPIIHGFVCIKKSVINGKYIHFCLLSRRSTERAGVRYYRRGIDHTGSVANFVETEQIVFSGGNSMSFVQTRGSIPLHWSQKPCLIYKPAAVISDCSNQKDSLQKHFDQQITHYGQQVVINLIDQKGSEQLLGQSLQYYLQSLASCLIWYVDFDFHKECSKMRWYRLSILTERVAAKQAEFGYFVKDSTGTILSVQQGVFRTNCMDCLDRTNVVQSLLAHNALQHQLQKMNVLSDHENIEDHKELEYIFKNVWADNADICAKQYAGTGALKTDFTRTGKRTFPGVLKDGYNSAVRYYYNNFNDGYRQDAIDVFLGNYVVDRMETSSIPPVQRSRKYYVMPTIILVTFSLFFMTLLIPSSNTGYHFLKLLHTLFWGGLGIFSLLYVCMHGEEFVDVPRLVRGNNVL